MVEILTHREDREATIFGVAMLILNRVLAFKELEHPVLGTAVS